MPETTYNKAMRTAFNQPPTPARVLSPHHIQAMHEAHVKANAPRELTEEEKPGAVKCKLGVHTPLLIQEKMRCVFCGKDLGYDSHANDLWARVRYEQETVRWEAASKLTITLEEREKYGKRIGKHGEREIPMPPQLPTPPPMPTQLPPQTVTELEKAYRQAQDGVEAQYGADYSKIRLQDL